MYPGRVITPFAIVFLIVFLTGCAAGGGASTSDIADATEGREDVSDLLIVDCLLPGQVRRLGGMTYVSPRRPTRTTAKDCSIRGGEYVAYDRADYRSALRVWLERAEEGDPEAQTYVGEIFEKGLGREPDYESAVAWYRRAAEQDYSRAQVNLGFMYESGLGVERDVTTALNWYRKASGLSGDELILESEMQAEIEALREELEHELQESAQQAEALETQLARLQAERQELEQQLASTTETVRQQERELESAQETVESQQERIAAAEAEAQRRDQRASAREETRQLTREALEAQLAAAEEQINALSTLYSRASTEKDKLQQELAELPRTRSIEPRLEPSTQVTLTGGDAREFQDINFGRYYALIIGNEDYQHLEDLESPMHDARRVKELLETRYGFTTVLLPNANQFSILNAINDLHEQIEPQDNLLIYYAGHGNLSEAERAERRRGYWLPVDARPDRLVHWINNSVISDHLDRIEARSVLVMADSCYAGALASEGSALLLGSSSATLSKETIEHGLSRRSRIVISSGGIAPVLDTLDGEHSLFARSLIEVLESNDQVLRENQLFARVAVNVRRRARENNVDQTPEMRPIRDAGHEGGDFYFIPTAQGS